MTAPAQVFNNDPYSTKNYMLAGIRILLAQKIGAATTGFRYIGNILTPDINVTEEMYQHFASAVGQDKLDFDAPIKSEGTIKFSTDEMSTRNMQLFFHSAAVNSVAAAPTGTTGPELIVAGSAGEYHGLSENPTDAQIANIKVYDQTGTALLVNNTDYEIVRVLGRVFVHMLVSDKAGHILSIGEGATGANPYHYAGKAYLAVNPVSIPKIECKAIIQIFPVAGKGLEWYINNANITRGSKFGVDKKQASTMDFQLNLLDDTVANPGAPFGVIRDYGYMDDGSAVI